MSVKKGTAVIDQRVKGFVVDSDGKIGLRGTVVSKMGAMVARSVIAGFFSGIGDAIKSANNHSKHQSIRSNTGNRSQPNAPSRSRCRYLQRSSTNIQFYLELARQTMPVIEVGAVRDVTLVISEA